MQSNIAGMPAAVPRLLSVATAVPKYKLSQNAISDTAARMFVTACGSSSGLARIYSNAAIRTRYSCVPLDWYERTCPFSARNRLYRENAVNLLAEAARKAVERARLTFGDIDGLVVVSSSGIATPSLDALLTERLGLKRNMERLPVFGPGCGGGVSGLARTSQLARGAPGKRYLYMVVELCGLDFIHADRSKSKPDPALLLLYFVLQLGRLWVIMSLGPFWTTRIIILPVHPLIRSCPHRYFSHSNYMIVVAEIALLPLAFGNAAVSLVWSVGNALLLALRIHIENAALAACRDRHSRCGGHG
jgi:isoprenylcysteine carboxyl methyltransferase (ICMT) family protein YpbQ